MATLAMECDLYRLEHNRWGERVPHMTTILIFSTCTDTFIAFLLDIKWILREFKSQTLNTTKTFILRNSCGVWIIFAPTAKRVILTISSLWWGWSSNKQIELWANESLVPFMGDLCKPSLGLVKFPALLYFLGPDVWSSQARHWPASSFHSTACMWQMLL